MTAITVLVNGLPGNMGHEVSAACLRRGFKVGGAALTGPSMPGTVDVTDGEGGPATSVRLIGPGPASETELRAMQTEAAAEGRVLVAIDFTHPSAVNANAALYAALQLPFVMGTTGGDRAELDRVTRESGVYAVIAPNMCKQIVALQAMMATMSSQYPGAFGGYSFDIVESHQSGKADTSGTAKDMVRYFDALRGGEPFPQDQIRKIRDPPEQLAFGVPESALKGHAWHTYSLKSSDGSVEFQFKHNVCGRRTYAEGVADAVAYLAEQISAKAEKKLYDMIDVLRAGKCT